MATLYDLTNDYKTLLDLLEDPDMDPNAIDEAMASIGGEFDEKVENYAKIIRELEAQEAAFDTEIERMTKRKKTCSNSRENLKQILINSMQMAQKEKVEGELFKVSIKRCAPKVVIDAEDQIPEQFLEKVETVKVDKKGIGAFLKENPFTTAGFAHLEEVNSLLIK